MHGNLSRKACLWKIKVVKDSLTRIQKTTIFLMLSGFVLTVLFGEYFFAGGLVIGTFLGLLNFKLLARNAVVFTSLRNGEGRRYLLFTYLVRFGLIGSVLSLCILKDIAMFAGAACGLLFLQAAIFININSFHVRGKGRLWGDSLRDRK